MKIFVDKLPDIPEECIFRENMNPNSRAYYEGHEYYCPFRSKEFALVCCLYYDEPCPFLKEFNEEEIEENTVDRVERIMAERRKMYGDQDSCKDIMEMIIGETE